MRRFAFVLLSALVATASIAVPSVLAAPPAPPADEPAAVPRQLLVGYREGASPSARAEARGQASAKLVERVVAGRAGRAEVELVALPGGASRDAAIRRLEDHPAVAYAEPNWVVTTAETSDDPYYTGGNLWGAYGDATSPKNSYGSQAGEAWGKGNVGSSSVVVGVIDTGVDVSHPDLKPNVWVNPYEAVNGKDDDGNGYVDDINGWDFHNGDATVYDSGDGDSHGTHVAGTIAGVGGNGTGVAGVAWKATIVPAKFLGPKGGTTSNAVKAVDYLTDLKKRHGMNVVATNNSWSGGGYSTALYDAIGRADAAGIVFVAAAGNGGSDGVGDDNDATPQYPSSYDKANIIAVASLTSSGSKSGFSNYGSESVDLGAPGSSINSTVPGGGYGSKSGTSMATPHVTGGAVLAAANGLSGDATIKAAILDSTVTTASMDKTVTGGRLDVSGFVTATTSSATALDDSASVDEDGSLSLAEPGVLGNDTGASSAKLASGPSNGTLSFPGDGSFTYSPEGDFSGTDSFTYQAVDGDGLLSAAATVTITVDPVNDAPVAVADSYTATAGVPLSVSGPGVLANDTDVDGDELSAAIVGEPAHGTVSLDVDGSFTYTANTGYTGADSFTYRASDGVASSEATVSLAVSASATTSSATFVSDLDGSATNRGSSWTPTVTIHVSPAVAGATVSGRWGSGSTVTCTTTSTGSCPITGPTVKKSTGTMTFHVTDVTLSGYTYDATSNTDPDGDSDGNEITISKP